MLTLAELISRFEFCDVSEADDRIALRVEIGPKVRHRTITVGELARASRDMAARLVMAGSIAGQRIALLMPHSEHLVIAFLGAIRAGMIPSIIAWPTSKMDAEKYRRNLLGVLASLQADCLVTEPAMAHEVGHALGTTRVLDLTEAATSAVTRDSATLNRTGTAFIQFSGGTTGCQKSVPVSFQQLHSQLESYHAVLRFKPNDRIISWLPLYHDMGLVACLLMPFVMRLPVVMLAPMEWVMDPRPFLRAVAEHRATLCWLPNFAFSFLAARAERFNEQFDLSSVRAVINCSEPVRAESMDTFVLQFQPSGLRADAMHTCYAMAEATFAVAQTSDALPPKRIQVAREDFSRGWLRAVQDGGRTLVSCGPPIPGMELRIIDDDAAECVDGHIGTIEIRGPSVMQGYLNTASESGRGPSEGGWYSTGDLGSVLDGQLYVTGRKNDVIIVGGVNIYPEDVEAAVSAIEGVKAGRAVALGFLDASLGTEKLVVVAEVADEALLTRTAEFESSVRTAVLIATGLAPNRVFIVPPNWMIKSTAGKIARAETRTRVLVRWHELTGETLDPAISVEASS